MRKALFTTGSAFPPYGVFYEDGSARNIWRRIKLIIIVLFLIPVVCADWAFHVSHFRLFYLLGVFKINDPDELIKVKSVLSPNLPVR